MTIDIYNDNNNGDDNLGDDDDGGGGRKDDDGDDDVLDKHIFGCSFQTWYQTLLHC